MQMVLPWGKGIAQYKSEFKNMDFEKPERCPHCGCVKFHKWGKYERYVVEEGEEERISIQRVCCVKCLKTYSYLPSFCVSGVCYSVDYIITLLRALILKTRFELGELRRRAYAYLRRFADFESLWLVFLRARGFGDFSPDKKERMMKIFTALLDFHQNTNLLAGFFQETGRHFMPAK